jgi:3-oxoadipate enol-lactonase
MPTNLIRGAQISWSAVGRGSTVIVAHGLSRSRAKDALGPYDWSPVAETHRLIAYDARGHGESTGDPSPSEYRWSELARDLLELLDQIAPTEKVSGIGSSMGTATLLHAAVREPSRFDRLVLALPPTAWSSRAGQAELYLAGADLVERDGLSALLELIESMPPPPLLASLDSYDRVPDVREDLLPSVLRGVADSDLPEPSSIQELSLPVLLLGWADDLAHPLSTSETLLSLIDGAKLSVAASVSDVVAWGSLASNFLN